MCKIIDNVDTLDVVDMFDVFRWEVWELEENEYLNTEQAIVFLGVSRPTLFRLIKEFNIQVYTRVGKANYYKQSDLQKIKETRNQFRPKSPQLAAAA